MCIRMLIWVRCRAVRAGCPRSMPGSRQLPGSRPRLFLIQRREIVRRTPRSAADPLVGLLESYEERDEGVPRGPGGPPYLMPAVISMLRGINVGKHNRITMGDLRA